MCRFEQKAGKTDFATAINTVEVNRLEGCPVEAAGMASKFFNLNGSCVPNVDPAILRAGHEEVLETINASAFINFDVFGNELHIRDEILMRALND